MFPIGNYIGLRVGKRGGVSWTHYWSTLISATVENVAPTNVVLTFPNAQKSLGASDFTITGFTISSASWTGAVLILVLSTAVLVFDEDLIITFVRTGETGTVTNNVLDDGDTVAWYDSQDLTTITKDGGNLVSRWNDKLGSGNDLIQADGLKQPLWSADGVLFDGIDNYMRVNVPTFVQPEHIYMVIKQVTWTLNDSFFDGYNAGNLGIAKTYDVTPKFRVYAGAYSAEITDMAVDNWCILRVLFNGITSRVQVNNSIGIDNNFGAANMVGLTLGCNGGLGNHANIEIKEIILRDVADSQSNEVAIYNYLQSKYNIGVPENTRFDNGKLVITFDDTADNIHDTALPIIISKGINATFYVIASTVETGGSTITWAELVECQNNGIEIQCHSNAGTDLTTLTEAQIRTNIEAVNTAFAANGLNAPLHHAYPGGAYNSTVISTVDDYRLTGRGIGGASFTMQTYRNSTKMILPAAGIDNYDDAAMILIKARLDVVQSRKCAYITYCHGVKAVGDAGAISTEHFTELIDYAQSIGMDIISISQLYNLML